MPIQLPNFPVPTFEQSTPMLTGMKAGLGMYGDILNQIFRQQEIEKERILNKYLPQRQQAEISEMGARTGLIGEQTKEKAYERTHGYPSVQEQAARAGLLGEQSKQLHWMAEHGYPTDEIRKLEWIQNYIKQQQLLQQQQQQQQLQQQLQQQQQQQLQQRNIGAGAPQAPTPGAGTFASPNLAQPNLQNQLQQLPQTLAQQAAPSSAYFNRPPQVGINIPGSDFDPNMKMMTNAINAMFPLSPQDQERVKQYDKDYQAEIDRYKTITENSSKAAKQAPEVIRATNSLMDSYNRIQFAKGAVGGWGPAMSTAAKTFEAERGKLQGALSVSYASGRGGVTQADIGLAGKQIESRDMPEDTFIRLNNAYRYAAENDVEYDNFMNDAALKGIKSSVAKQAWNRYRAQRPVMNTGKGEFMQNNAYQNTSGDYITPEAINAILNKQKYVPPNQKQLTSQNITNKEVETFSKQFGMKKIDAIQIINNPTQFLINKDPKDLERIPLNIRIQIRKNAVNEGYTE